MKIEEAIEILENGGWWDLLIPITTIEGRSDEDKLHQAIDMAITALRSMSEAGEYHLRDGTKMVPLSLEQLKQMVGKPVWIERIEAPYDGKWFIVNYADTENPDKTLYTDSGVTYSEYGKYFIAYPYPPAHIDRSEWEGCRKCRSCWTCKSAIEPVRAENSKCFLCEDLSNYEPLNFCSHCGRPLTEEAWVELERRVKG